VLRVRFVRFVTFYPSEQFVSRCKIPMEPKTLIGVRAMKPIRRLNRDGPEFDRPCVHDFVAPYDDTARVPAAFSPVVIPASLKWYGHAPDD